LNRAPSKPSRRGSVSAPRHYPPLRNHDSHAALKPQGFAGGDSSIPKWHPVAGPNAPHLNAALPLARSIPSYLPGSALDRHAPAPRLRQVPRLLFAPIEAGEDTNLRSSLVSSFNPRWTTSDSSFDPSAGVKMTCMRSRETKQAKSISYEMGCLGRYGHGVSRRLPLKVVISNGSPLA